MNIIRKNDQKCSQCGYEVSKMIEDEQNEKAKLEQLKDQEVNEVEVEQEQSESINKEEQVEQEQPVRKRHKHKPKPKKIRPEDKPEYTVNEDGTYSIDTSDVTYLEDIDTKSYSVKKARGDAPAVEKLKWWEIYKWADRALARRKIKKEVKKASYKVPFNVKSSIALIWCITFGWLGIHNFYAHNYKKGFTVLIADILVAIIFNVPILYEIMGIFVGGGLGFMIIAMWFGDLVGLIMRRYSYRISKEEFISNLNLETRAKLGKRYIGFDRNVFKAKEEKRLRRYFKKLEKKKEKELKKQNGKNQ